jgi:succinate-semialdehyde dehydrogenase/glutarate-semialdehyde dehydrogenase
VTLTGSTHAGSEVAANAGRHLKPMVMELGGSDAFVVLADADVASAAATGVRARCVNGGQSCIAAKRFIVDRAVYDDFLDAFVEGMRARVPGDPRTKGVDLGPIAREDLRDTLADQVRRSVAAGARVAHCGEVPDRGFFHPPMVLVDVDGTPAMEEELFGPVAAVTVVDGDDEAIARANATRYGLGASLFTRDLDRARSLAARIDAGSVFVNGQVKSDPRLPFGGTKDSGFGRELGREGILEFVNAKTVWIA